MIMYNFFLFLIPCLSINLKGCNDSPKGHSYNISFYKGDPRVKDNFLFKNDLISYDKKLFEFDYAIRRDDTLIGKELIVKSIHFDTTSVLILDGINRKFYEFDTFSNIAKQVAVGNFSQKKGIKLADTSQIPKKIDENQLRDTLINDIRMKYLFEIQKNNFQEDSILSYSYFLENESFISLIDLLGARVSPKYSLVGFSQFWVKEKESVHAIIENLRLLTKKEEQICSSMISKINLNLFSK